MSESQVGHRMCSFKERQEIIKEKCKNMKRKLRTIRKTYVCDPQACKERFSCNLLMPFEGSGAGGGGGGSSLNLYDVKQQ